MEMDDEDAGSEGLGRYPACLEFPVVQILGLDMYESEGHEFIYLVTKQQHDCPVAWCLVFRVWNFTEVKQDEGIWMLASVCTLHLPSGICHSPVISN